MTPEKIVENHKKYVLQSWSKQGNLNPIPVAKADGIYFTILTVTDIQICHHSFLGGSNDPGIGKSNRLCNHRCESRYG